MGKLKGKITIQYNAEKKKEGDSEYEDTLLLHNIGSKRIKKPEYIGELHLLKKKCERCKLIVERVRSLLDDIRAIKAKEVIGVCDHCKRATCPNKTCKRCDLIGREFISAHEKTRERQQYFKVWLCKVNHLLQAIVDGESVCQRDTELERIMHAIKEPLGMREPDIDLFPNLDQEKLVSFQSLSENKEILEELLSKMKFVAEICDSSSECLHPSHSQEISLYKIQKKEVEKRISGLGLISNAHKALGLGQRKDKNIKMIHGSVKNLNKALTSGTGEEHRLSTGFKKVVSKGTRQVLRSSYTKRKTSFDAAGHGVLIDKSLVDSEKSIAKKVTKPRKSATKKPLQLQKNTSEKYSKTYSSVDKTLGKGSELEKAGQRGLGHYSSERKETENLKKKEKSIKGKENLSPEDEKKRRYLKTQSKQNLTTPLLRDAKELSEILLYKNQVKAEKFKLNKQRQIAKMTETETIRLKKLTSNNVRKMKKIIPLPSSLDEVTELVILGNTTPSETKDIEENRRDTESLLSNNHLLSIEDPTGRRNLKYQTLFKNGAVKYQLSNEEFIRKGWTILPTEKIMRRMNIYRMEPAQVSWFERHQQDGVLFYDSGQKLADIDHNGCGHWYYRNGTIALEYYNAKEYNVAQRYIVYSSGTEMEYGKIRPRTILALFDVLGHGVIYDLHGTVRLKYNQSEGLLVDPKIGPPNKWKWHTLNDPPVLQRVCINKCLKERDPRLERVRQSTSKDFTEVARPANPEMVAIELNNFVKEKKFKLKQKFRPFQISFKSVKLNEHFSLKILDQANICLLYRDGVTRLKLNLGMLLKSDEIIDTVTSDVGDVSTPYDIRPAKTESVENIQKILKNVRSGKLPLAAA